METTRLTKQEWLDKGKDLFGDDMTGWRFRCPVCGNVASVGDYRAHKDAGATPESAIKECIGRYQDGARSAFYEKGKGPCTYAGYGFFRLSPVVVVEDDGNEVHCFAFEEKA